MGLWSVTVAQNVRISFEIQILWLLINKSMRLLGILPDTVALTPKTFTVGSRTIVHLGDTLTGILT